MRCPLLMAAWISNPNDKFREDFDLVFDTECDEDDCAWWDSWDKCCSILSINRELSRICSAIDHNLVDAEIDGKTSREGD